MITLPMEIDRSQSDWPGPWWHPISLQFLIWKHNSSEESRGYVIGFVTATSTNYLVRFLNRAKLNEVANL